ncbi:MAG: FadR family transcriptional regulator [Betaproteobacteria bacterium]|nr:FadR family transcriptional regulator [Betaproteobacteria bacterium]
MNRSTDALALGRLNVPKAGDVLADQLRTRIRSGELREGQGLPTERELVEQTRLSRMSVREALRILEAEGLIVTRPGRNGGSQVRRPTGDALIRHLELFIWGRHASLDDLHDVREALELLAAEGAARHRTETDIKELAEKTATLEAAVDDVDAYLAANLDWHKAVARASHNELLVGFMNVLTRVIHDATASEAFDSSRVRASTVRVHRNILAAIVDRDADAARRRMARDVAAARRVALNWGHAHRDRAPQSAPEPPRARPAAKTAHHYRSADKADATRNARGKRKRT